MPFLYVGPVCSRVVRFERTTRRDGKTAAEVQYAITSLSPRQADAGNS